MYLRTHIHTQFSAVKDHTAGNAENSIYTHIYVFTHIYSQIFSAVKDPTAGNARFVRNTLEKAIMRQAERLCTLAVRSREQLTTLEAADFGSI